jgi:hypothetical protein
MDSHRNEVDAPQAVLHVSDEREPRWTIATGRRSEAPSKDTTHHILPDVDTERMGNLLGNSRAPESRIAVLHLVIAAMSSVEGPLGPGRRRAAGVNSNWYFRWTSAR